jgi:AmmeMemoRadiSam system protein A
MMAGDRPTEVAVHSFRDLAAVTRDTPCPPPPAIGPEERAMLLEVARRALDIATRAYPAAALDRLLAGGSEDAAGNRRAAAFVTLFAAGRLRGCVGTFDASRPLPIAVADAALSAALEDPRFPPLREGELADVEIEISVLGPFADVRDPALLELGVDGVVVERDGRRALLLPEVAAEQGWDRPTLLRALCQKAGLPSGAWQDAATRLIAFRTVRFGGPARPAAATGQDAG